MVLINEKNNSNIIGLCKKVLDKGFVRVVDVMGSDKSVVDAARTSYGEGTTTTRSDEKLINYLMEHKHLSPFEMCEIKFHIKLPIFVARQWVRHRTANVNEQSMRYSKVENEFYIPEVLNKQSTTNKQCSDEPLEKQLSDELINEIREHSNGSISLYDKLIEQGVSRELARMVIPVNIYTEWFWKIDLRNLLHFISLRIHSGAQKEIKEYAEIILGIIQLWVPRTTEAFKRFVLTSFSLSEDAVSLLKQNLKKGLIDYQGNTNLTKSEFLFLSKLFSD